MTQKLYKQGKHIPILVPDMLCRHSTVLDCEYLTILVPMGGTCLNTNKLLLASYISEIGHLNVETVI